MVNRHQSKWTSGNQEPVLVAEHKIHLETVGRCIRAEIEDTRQINNENSRGGNIQQVNLCVDMSRSNLVNLAVDSIENGQKETQFDARVDSRSALRALRLSLQWNPRYSRQILTTLLSLNQQSQQTLIDQLSEQEFIQEFLHKYSIILRQLTHGLAIEPLQTIVIDELLDITRELGFTSQVIRNTIEPLRQWLEVIVRYYLDNVQRLQSVYQEWIANVDRLCVQSKTCTKIQRLVETVQNTDDLSRLITEPLVQLLQNSHRFVTHSQGKLAYRFPQISRLWEKFVPLAIQDLFQATIQTVYDVARNLWLNPQNPFAVLWQQVEQIVRELTQTDEWRQVRWERIQEALEQSAKLLFSPSVWTSSVRVLNWDPQNGQVQLEIRSPSTVQQEHLVNNSQSTSPFFGIFGSQQIQSNISGTRSTPWLSNNKNSHGINSNDGNTLIRYRN